MDTDELKNLLIDLRKELRNNTKTKWNRVLSFGEDLSDRWERSKFLGFGNKTSIYESSMVFGNVIVGENTWIGPFTILDGSGGLKIGSNCSISAGVQIYSHDTVDKRISKERKTSSKENTTIGDNCYIGPMALIRKGVTIGHHTVIGTHSYVNKSFPPYSIVAGMPAKKIGKITINEDGTSQLVYFDSFENTILKSIESIEERIMNLEKKLKE